MEKCDYPDGHRGQQQTLFVCCASPIFSAVWSWQQKVGTCETPLRQASQEEKSWSLHSSRRNATNDWDLRRVFSLAMFGQVPSWWRWRRWASNQPIKQGTAVPLITRRNLVALCPVNTVAALMSSIPSPTATHPPVEASSGSNSDIARQVSSSRIWLVHQTRRVIRLLE